jgi:hypothetical protein
VVVVVVQVLEGERDAVLYYLLARHPGRALVSRGGGGGVVGVGGGGVGGGCRCLRVRGMQCCTTYWLDTPARALVGGEVVLAPACHYAQVPLHYDMCGMDLPCSNPRCALQSMDCIVEQHQVVGHQLTP